MSDVSPDISHRVSREVYGALRDLDLSPQLEAQTIACIEQVDDGRHGPKFTTYGMTVAFASLLIDAEIEDFEDRALVREDFASVCEDVDVYYHRQMLRKKQDVSAIIEKAQSSVVGEYDIEEMGPIRRQYPIQCGDCGKEFHHISNHWIQSSCSYPTLSEYQKEVIKGLILGDGSLVETDNHSQMAVGMCVEPYISWLGEMMTIASPKYFSEDREGDESTYYRINFARHPFITEMNGRWYEMGTLSLPEELELTRPLLQTWYVSDGNVNWKYGRCEGIVITGNVIERNKQCVSGLFDDIGFEGSIYGNRIMFDDETARRMLAWMGSSPPGFEYKWELESRERYDSLRDEVYQ